MRAAVVVGCCCILALAGCLDQPPNILLEPTSPAAAPGFSVVIAVVDSGLNPYHEAFRDPHATLPATFVDANTGLAPQRIDLTEQGSLDERVSADHGTWESLERGKLYWFAGTRVLGISFKDPSADAYFPYRFLDDLYHGTAVASVARSVSQQAWIVVVQIPLENTRLPEYFETGPAGVAWAAAQPWIDVLSLSIGLEGNPPLLPAWPHFAAATRAAVETGKLVVAAAFNLPTPTIGSGTSGPPWVISVGGVEPSTHGEQLQSGRFVDVVSDYTRLTAYYEPDAYENASGTSVGTPVVAGVLANAILELRSRAGESGSAGATLCACNGRNLTQAHLRQALNATARYWSATEYDPLNYSSNPVMTIAYATIPILPAPWTQMGWGYVGQEFATELVHNLESPTPPARPAAAAAYMATQQAAREAYWANDLPLP